jgi:hypothetical protein
MFERLHSALAAAAVVVLFLATCAVATAQTGAGFTPVTADAGIGPAAGNQTEPYIAKGGDGYLAVWSDARTAVPSDDPDEPPGYASGMDIYAVRLDSSGNPIETLPIVISDDLGDQFGARASWNGSNWLVTWTSQAPNGDAPGYFRGVEAVRMSPDGVILDEPFLVYPGPSGEVHYLATGSDGTDWVVFISETIQSGMNTETYLEGIRIGPGAALAAPTVMFHPSCCYFFPLGTEAAYANGQYFLVFECIDSIYVNDAICGMRFTQSLSKIDTYPFEVAGTGGVFRLPQVATDGTDYLVGWYYTFDYPPSLVTPYCARVTGGGVSLDPTGIDLSNGVGSGVDRNPRLAWDGTNWLAVWPDDQGARAARITPDGTVLDPGGVSFPGLGCNSIVDLPGGARIVWSDDDAGGFRPNDVFTTYISGAPAADPETPIGLGAPAQVHPDVASGATDAMLVFRSDISGSSRIMAQAASLYEGRDRAEPTMIAEGPFLTDPEVAWNGSLYLVVWSDEASEKIVAARVMQDGTVLDDPAISVMDGLDPDVAAVGEDFLVVATDGSATVRQAYGARVRGSDGAVLDGTPVTIGYSFAVNPRVAGLVNRWIVTWEKHPAYDDETADVYAAFFDTDGTTPGQFAVASDASSDTHYAPAIAASAGIALIVWEDDRAYPGDDWNLYGRRVRVDGVLMDAASGFAVAESTLDERNAAVGWNGSVFQVAFEVTQQIDYFDHSLADIRGTRVDLNGQVVEPGNFAIQPPPGDSVVRSDVLPSVSGSNSESLVAISTFFKDAPYASYRLVLRTLGDGGTGVVDNEPEATEVRLAGAFPNPSDASTVIRFSLPASSRVTLVVYDVTGRVVRRLLDAEMPVGESDVTWDGLDESGQPVANGLYFYRLKAGDASRTGKLAVLR